MKKIYDMSAAEMEVMEKLWEHEEGIKQAELLALFEEDGKALSAIEFFFANDATKLLNLPPYT